MDDKQPQPVNIHASLSVFGMLALLAYWLITALIDKLNSINSDLGKALVAGGATILVAVTSLVIGKLWEQRVRIQQDIREKKIPVYEKQIQTFFSILFAEKYGDKKPTQDELGKAFQEFTEKLIIRGSAEVIQAWLAFRLHDWQNSDIGEGLLKVEALLKSIRKDLGNSNSNLADGDITKLFVNDFQVEVFNTKPVEQREVVHLSNTATTEVN